MPKTTGTQMPHFTRALFMRKYFLVSCTGDLKAFNLWRAIACKAGDDATFCSRDKLQLSIRDEKCFRRSKIHEQISAVVKMIIV